MQQQQSLLEGKLTRPPAAKPEPRAKTTSVTLIAANGMKWDEIQLRADRNLPTCILWGVADARRIFLRDGSSKTYKEVSWVEPQMPGYIPL